MKAPALVVAVGPKPQGDSAEEQGDDYGARAKLKAAQAILAAIKSDSAQALSEALATHAFACADD